MSRAATIVLDEHLSALQRRLEEQGLTARTVGDFRATSTLDPDVIRAIDADMGTQPWVLATMDATIPEEYRRFEWERYAIAWIVIDPHLRGIDVEHAKAEVLRRHAGEVVGQRPGDLFTYTRSHVHRAPPSLVSTLRRSDPLRR